MGESGIRAVGTVPPSTASTPAVDREPSPRLSDKAPDSVFKSQKAAPLTNSFPGPIRLIRWIICQSLTFPCFEPPPNRRFTEIIQLAKASNIPLKLDKSPLGRLIVRYLDNSSLTYSQQEVMRGKFIFGLRSLALHSSLHFEEADSFPNAGGYHDQLEGRVFDRISPHASGEVGVQPIMTYLDWSDAQLRVTVVNSLTNDILFQMKYDAVTTPPGKVAKAVQRSIDRAKLQKNLDQILPLPPDKQDPGRHGWVFSYLETAGLSEGDRRQIQEEWDQLSFESISITVEELPFYESDIAGDQGLQSRLAGDDIERAGYRPVAIRGGSGRIRIKIIKKGGVSPLELEYEPLFAKNQGEPRWQPLKLDLTAIGLGTLEHLFYREALYPVTREGPYRTYADGGKATYEKHQGALHRAVEGLARVEQEFGKRPGEIIHEIYVPNRILWKGSVLFKRHQMVQLNDEILRFHGSSLTWIAQHEAFHVYDMHYQFSSDPEFTSWFEKNERENPGCLEQVSEAYTYRSILHGEAQQDALEFFASLSNSLYSPRLLKGLQQSAPRFRNFYVKSLKILKSVISRRLDPSAPILRRVDRVIREARDLD